MRLFESWPLAAKFSLIGALLAAPVAIATTMLVQSMSEGIEFARKESRGLELHQDLRQALDALQAHRRAAVQAAAGDREAGVALQVARSSVDQALERLEARDASGAGSEFSTTDGVTSLRQKWKAMRTGSGGSVDDALAAHDAVVREAVSLMDKVATNSGMVLDPDADSLFMLLVLSQQIPGVTERLSQLHGSGITAIASGRVGNELREHMARVSGMTLGVREDLLKNAAQGFDANAELGTRLRGAVDAVGNGIAATVEDIHSRILTPATVTLAAPEFGKQIASSASGVYRLYDDAYVQTQSLLEARVARLSTKKWMVLGAVLAFLAVGAFTAFAIVRSVIRGAAQASKVASDVAKGEMDNEIAAGGGDEIGAVLNAMRGMQAVLRRFSQAQEEMSRRHADGQISFRMRADEFPGAYGRMAAQTNGLVQAHIEVSNRIVDTVAAYARGSFEVRMEALPGEKARITEAVENVRVGLKAGADSQRETLETLARFEAAQARMAERHEAGWVDEQIPADQFQGSYRKMAQSINDLVAAHLATTARIVAVVTHYSDGDFEVRMDRLPGKKAQITEAVEKVRLGLKAGADSQRETLETLARFEAAQARMAEQHDAGWIDEQIPVDQFQGPYRKMAESINELVRSHIAVKMRIVEVVGRYARGDLSVDMDRLPGKKAQITEAVDGVKASLSSINGDIQRLVDAAVRGEFGVRGQAERYEYDFRRMVEGLNRLMEVSDRGLNEVSRVLGALSQGDLTETISTQYQGTFDRLKGDANTTVAQLAQTVTELKASAEAISTAAKEIAAGNSDLSNRTEQQASSLEETASSMEELTSTVKQNAENAKQANQLAIGASSVAVKGGQVVGQVVATMESIAESSRKVADIITVIDGIAFQTNILALNAAVEAARAGEQGRGFAVVASEVRNLAQRSAEAAKQIEALISDSVEKVRTGSRLVDEAGQTMEEIVGSVKRVTDIMAEITAASVEQSSGIEQVNQAIVQMDEVTQQNAALVEQAAAAAESLEEQSQSLEAVVATFRLAGAGEGGGERRGPDRATNVARLSVPARVPVPPSAPSRGARRSKVVGGEDSLADWAEF